MSFSPALTVPALLSALLAFASGSALAQNSCSSDGAARPGVLVERFIADRCDECWRGTPPAMPRDALALDWIVPSGDPDAPMAPAALTEATQRLSALGQVPDSRMREERRSISATPSGGLRLAQGPVVNDYIGVSMAWKPAASDLRVLGAWLLLVEEIPAGTAGSPAARRLVRGAFSVDGIAGGRKGWEERRAMRVPAGANPANLRLVGWLADRHGSIGIAAITRCAL